MKIHKSVAFAIILAFFAMAGFESCEEACGNGTLIFENTTEHTLDLYIDGTYSAQLYEASKQQYLIDADQTVNYEVYYASNGQLAKRNSVFVGDCGNVYVTF